MRPTGPCLLLGLTLAACTFEAAPHHETRMLSLVVPKDGRVDVRTESGSVRVVAGDDEKLQVLAEVRASTRPRLKALRVRAEIQEEGTLSLRPVWPDGGRRGGESVAFELRLPPKRALAVRTRSGRIGTKGLRAVLTLESENGRVTVEDHEGPVVARTTNGSMDVRGRLGPCRLGTTNGRLEVRGAAGAVEARTENGRILVVAAPGAVGPFDLATTNGRLALLLPEGFAGVLVARAASGRVRIEDLPEVHREGGDEGASVYRIGGGGPRSRLSTRNGSIRIAGSR